MPNYTQYEICPACGKKGWHLDTPPGSNLAHYEFHTCKYCYSTEGISIENGKAVKYLKKST
jgi:hypothetical protein